MSNPEPYKKLGIKIKSLREKAQETLGEVSSAVELHIDELSKIEQGITRPSEDILSLIISHYDLKDGQAEILWKLAGYDKSDLLDAEATIDPVAAQTVLVTAFDARIVYADMVHVMVNKYGVVLNFMQGAGPNNQPLAISRIGMSKEHAKSVLEVLQKTLDQVEGSDKKDTKSLPAPNEPKNN